MAGSEDHDLYMILMDQDGDPVAADSRTDFTAGGGASSPLLEGFSAGYVFEIQTFSMSASGDGKKRDKTLAAGNLEGLPAEYRDQWMSMVKALAVVQQKQHVAETVQNQAQTVGKGKKEQSHPVHPVTFTREIDSSSVPIMDSLINKGWYQQCSIVKRKAAGTAAAGEAYLRIDFDDVLVQNVGWNDGERVTENVTFICRGVTMQYRPQNDDGSLGDTIPGEWSIPDPDC